MTARRLEGTHREEEVLLKIAIVKVGNSGGGGRVVMGPRADICWHIGNILAVLLGIH